MALQLPAAIIARADDISITVANPCFTYVGFSAVTLGRRASRAARSDDVSCPLCWVGVLFVTQSFRYAQCSRANRLGDVFTAVLSAWRTEEQVRRLNNRRSPIKAISRVVIFRY